MRFRTVRRVGLTLALIAATAVTGLVVAPAASAATATRTIDLRCDLNLFNIAYDQTQTLPVTLTAPASVAVGTPLNVTVDLPSGGPLNAPAALSNGVFQPTITLAAQLYSNNAVLASGTATGAATVPTTVGPAVSLPWSGAYTVPIPTTHLVPGDQVDIAVTDLRIAIVSGDDGIGGGLSYCVPLNSPQRILTVDVTGTQIGSADHCVVVSTSCSTEQDVVGSVLAGTLEQKASTTSPNPDDTTIELGSMYTSAVPQSLNGTMNTVTVTDTRGGPFQWSLTATTTNFVDPASDTIPKTLLSISPSCASSASGSAPGAAAGTAGQHFGASAVTLCTGPTLFNAGGSTGGAWAVDASLSLAVPPFQHVGDFVSTMTITLA